jgi:hypothetical protein
MDNEIIIAIVSLLAGYATGYTTSYFKEKGKNKALLEDIKVLTEEKEKITSKYELDVSKRKYKYEDKRNIYFKYFNLLDELNTDGLRISQEETMPAINKFTNDYLNANGNQKKILKAASELSETTNNSLMKMHLSQMKLKQETNSIKLIAGTTVLDALKALEIAYDHQLERSGQMMKELAQNIINNNQTILQSQQQEITRVAQHFISCKDTLIQRMKAELDEI